MNKTDYALDKARDLLEKESWTFVAIKNVGGTVYTSKERGVAPALLLYEENVSLVGFVIADKVVGKAAALMYVLHQVRAVHAQVISEPALMYLRDHDIVTTYDKLVGNIENRSQDGLCPLEQATLCVVNPVAGLICIKETLRELTRRTS